MSQASLPGPVPVPVPLETQWSIMRQIAEIEDEVRRLGETRRQLLNQLVKAMKESS